MNTHSCSQRLGVGVGEQRGADAARRVDRGVVDRDGDEVDQGQREAGDQTAEAGCELAGGGEQHDHHQQCGEDDLDDDGRADAEVLARPEVGGELATLEASRPLAMP